MKCQVCGTSVPSGGVECPLCGAPVPAAQSETPETSASPQSILEPGRPDATDATYTAGVPARPVRPVVTSRPPLRPPAEPPRPPAEPPRPPTRSGDSPGRSTALLAVAGLLVAVLAGGGVYVFTRAGQGSAPPEGVTTITMTRTRSTEPGTDTATAPPATTTTGTGTPTSTDTAANGRVTVGIVEMDASLAMEPAAQTAATTLSQLFAAIGDGRFSEAYNLYTPATRSRLGNFAAWAAGYRSTSYEWVHLDGVTGADGDVITAHVRLRSHQDPRDAPDGRSRCVDWAIAYQLVPASGTNPYLVGLVLPDVPAGIQPYRSCD